MDNRIKSFIIDDINRYIDNACHFIEKEEQIPLFIEAFESITKGHSFSSSNEELNKRIKFIGDYLQSDPDMIGIDESQLGEFSQIINERLLARIQLLSRVLVDPEEKSAFFEELGNRKIEKDLGKAKIQNAKPPEGEARVMNEYDFLLQRSANSEMLRDPLYLHEINIDLSFLLNQGFVTREVINELEVQEYLFVEDPNNREIMLACLQQIPSKPLNKQELNQFMIEVTRFIHQKHFCSLIIGNEMTYQVAIQLSTSQIQQINIARSSVPTVEMHGPAPFVDEITLTPFQQKSQRLQTLLALVPNGADSQELANLLNNLLDVIDANKLYVLLSKNNLTIEEIGSCSKKDLIKLNNNFIFDLVNNNLLPYPEALRLSNYQITNLEFVRDLIKEGLLPIEIALELPPSSLKKLGKKNSDYTIFYLKNSLLSINQILELKKHDYKRLCNPQIANLLNFARVDVDFVIGLSNEKYNLITDAHIASLIINRKIDKELVINSNSKKISQLKSAAIFNLINNRFISVNEILILDYLLFNRLAFPGVGNLIVSRIISITEVLNSIPEYHYKLNRIGNSTALQDHLLSKDDLLFLSNDVCTWLGNPMVIELLNAGVLTLEQVKAGTYPLNVLTHPTVLPLLLKRHVTADEAASFTSEKIKEISEGYFIENTQNEITESCVHTLQQEWIVALIGAGYLTAEEYLSQIAKAKEVLVPEISQLIVKKYLKIQEAFRLTESQLLRLKNPMVSSLIQEGLLSVELALDLNELELSQLIQCEIVQLLEKRKMTIEQAVTLNAIEFRNLSIPEMGALIINGFISLENAMNLHEEAYIKLKSKNITALIKGYYLTLEEALNLSPKVIESLRNRRLLALFKEGFLAVEQMDAMTDQGLLRLNDPGIHRLIMAGKISAEEALKLDVFQLARLSNPIICKLIMDHRITVSNALAMSTGTFEILKCKKIAKLIFNNYLRMEEATNLSAFDMKKFSDNKIYQFVKDGFLTSADVFQLKLKDYNRLSNEHIYEHVRQGKLSISDARNLSNYRLNKYREGQR